MECEEILLDESIILGKIVLEYILTQRVKRQGRLYSLWIKERVAGGGKIALLDAVTDDEDKAREIFWLFYEESVTPCTAADILQDLLYSP